MQSAAGRKMARSGALRSEAGGGPKRSTCAEAVILQENSDKHFCYSLVFESRGMAKQGGKWWR